MDIAQLASAIGAPAAAIIVTLWVLRSWFVERRNNRSSNPDNHELLTTISHKLDVLPTIRGQLDAISRRLNEY